MIPLGVFMLCFGITAAFRDGLSAGFYAELKGYAVKNDITIENQSVYAI